jgi:hypothetical protein
VWVTIRAAVRASNPPSNPALLDALTKDFLDHDFDFREPIRTIVNSRTYQASVATNEWNEKDVEKFLARHSAASQRRRIDGRPGASQEEERTRRGLQARCGGEGGSGINQQRCGNCSPRRTQGLLALREKVRN